MSTETPADRVAAALRVDPDQVATTERGAFVRDAPAAELEIPAKALAFHDRPHRVLLTDADVADRIRDVAAPVVAAELRKFADLADNLRMANTPVGDSKARAAAVWAYVDMRSRLLQRADELDPQ